MADHLDLVRAVLPDVDLRSVREIVTGWDFHILDVNGQWIFRFPRREACVATLRAEVVLLANLNGRLPIPIPHYEYAYVDCDWQDAFGAYQKLPGLASRHTGMPDDPVAPQRLAAFLTALHATPLQEFPDQLAAWSYDRWGERFRRARPKIESQVLPLLDEAQGVLLVEQWEAGYRLLSDFQPAFVHGDLNPDNLLVNPQQGLVSGVIDWGDACAGDPAIDFAWPLRSWSPGFVRQMIAAYGEADSTLFERAWFYALETCCDDIIYGPQHGDHWLGEGLRDLQAMLTLGS